MLLDNLLASAYRFAGYEGVDDYAAALDAGYPAVWSLAVPEPNWHDIKMAYLASEEGKAALRSQKIGALHALRDAERQQRETTTFPHGEWRFDCDERSVQRWSQVIPLVLAAIAADPTTIIVPTGWRDTGGTARLFTAAEIIAAHQSFVLHGAEIDAASQALKALIDAPDADLDELEATIRSDESWP